MTKGSWLVAMSMFLAVGPALEAAAQAPPAPALVAPANGAALVQPITLGWGAVVDPDGPIGSYTWQVSSTSTFGVVIASGFTNESGDPSIPTRTDDKVSGLPNGTYFWRVKATQIVGGATFSIDSPWSVVRSFTVVGLGPAPGRPSFTSPASPAQFHVREFFLINWTDVPDAHHYVLEADDEPSFSSPLTLTTDPLQFGTSFRAGWGNALSVFYRVVAVSADGVRGLPSPTLSVQITNGAPVPPPPSLLSPIGGASVTLPFTLDWTDTADPQVAGYEVDIDNEPNFLGTVGVLFVQGVTRSDYMVVPDPALEGHNIFPPGTYFWRVRAVHGDVSGPWSAGQSFTVLPLPATPPGLAVFHIINEPGSVSGGNSTQARVTLNMPAPAGGAVINIASDMPHAQVPATVVVPAGKTDATVSPITTIPVAGTTVGDVIAAYGLGWQQSSLGLFPILWGVALGNQAVIGGNSTVGRVTLLNPAPPGGVEVSLVNNDSDFISLPATVFIPAGNTGATFDVLTAPVAVPTQVTMDSGTAFEGNHAPSTLLTLLPPGSPPPPPSLSSLTLASARILGEGTTTGTATLTSPAPAGGAFVRLSGSMEGQVVTPAGVTVPAGSLSATFTITAPQVNAPRFVLVQGTFGSTGTNQATLLEIDPAPAGAPVLLALGASPTDLIGGTSTRGTVSLVMLAPPGGGSVTLTSTNPSVVQVPATVSIAAGNSANSFTVTSSRVSLGTTVEVDATAGGVTKSVFINVAPDPNAPPLLSSVTLAAPTVVGGNSVSGTVLLSGPAPAGGASVTLSTSNLVAKPPPVVNVPAGATSAGFTVTTSTVTANTPVTITAILGSVSKSVALTVTRSAAPPPTPGTPSLVSPADQASVAQPILFDWSDAANAATYLIQISTSSSFTTLTTSQTVSVSQATIGGLPAQQLFWRVRAVNSAGVAGSFSASRRVTPQGTPPPPPVASLSAVSLAPSSVVGGNPSQGTVTLTSAAPVGGAVVTLSSSNTTVASLPASVTVAAGATSGTFSITTAGVTAATPVTIGGSFGGVSKVATLTVNPPAPPAQTATLSVTATGRSGERVTSSPAGINVAVGSTGSATFNTGTSITLSVTNGRDAIWSGACSSGGSKAKTCRFTIQGNASVTANVQ